jgi:hypothetical protein
VFIGRTVLGAIFATFCSLILLPARAAEPTSRPATTQPVDRSTPRAALMAFFQATYQFNGDAAAAMCYATDEPGRTLALGMAAWVVSEAELRKVVLFKLGDGAAKELTSPPFTEEFFDKCTVISCDENHAQVRSQPNVDWPMVRANGEWYFAVGSWAEEQHLTETQGANCAIESSERNMNIVKHLLAGKRADVQTIKKYIQEGGFIEWK